MEQKASETIQSPLERQCSLQEGEIERLAMNVEDLLHKLSPVLAADEPSTATDSAKPVAEYSSPMAEKLAVNSARINNAANLVRHITRRLEV